MTTTGTIAETLWAAGCEGVRADDVAPTMFLVDDDGQCISVALGSAHPLAFVEALELDGRWCQLGVVCAATSWPGDAAGPSVRVRVVIVADRSGSTLTLQARDGVDVPERLSGEGGRLYAAMVAALVPVSELDDELNRIFAMSEGESER